MIRPRNVEEWERGKGGRVGVRVERRFKICDGRETKSRYVTRGGKGILAHEQRTGDGTLIRVRKGIPTVHTWGEALYTRRDRVT